MSVPEPFDALREELHSLYPGMVLVDTLYHDGKTFPITPAGSVRTPASRYRVEVLGVRMREVAEVGFFWVGLRPHNNPPDGWVAVLWRTRVYVLDGRAGQFSESHWRPGWSDTTTVYIGMEDVTKPEVLALRQADQTVRRGLRQRGGRPEGSGEYSTAERFLATLDAAIDGLRGRVVTVPLLTDAMSISRSRFYELCSASEFDVDWKARVRARGGRLRRERRA